jgi:hypothetical protein
MSKVTAEMLKKDTIAALQERRRELLEELSSVMDAFLAVHRQLAIELGEVPTESGDLPSTESTLIQ